MRFIKTLGKGKITELPQLNKIFEKYGIKLAYLFGSYAKDKRTKFSDIDIGVLYEKNMDKELDSIRVELIKILEEEAIDLIDLEKAPPKLKYKIMMEGKILHGEKEASQFEVQTMKEWFDFKPLEKIYFRRMEKRLKSGEYGR